MINRTLAFAAIIQQACTVKQLAETGKLAEPLLTTAMEATLNTTPSTTDEVFGSLKKYELGLAQTLKLLQESSETENRELLSLVFGIMHLERMLSKRKDLLAILDKGIKRAKVQAEHFSITHDNVIANLASLYVDSISTMAFNIKLRGQAEHLKSRLVINKIRALILAGIRYAVLWRQLDGSRWQFMFNKRSMIDEVKSMLVTAKQLEAVDA